MFLELLLRRRHKFKKTLERKIQSCTCGDVGDGLILFSRRLLVLREYKLLWKIAKLTLLTVSLCTIIHWISLTICGNVSVLSRIFEQLLGLKS